MEEAYETAQGLLVSISTWALYPTLRCSYRIPISPGLTPRFVFANPFQTWLVMCLRLVVHKDVRSVAEICNGAGMGIVGPPPTCSSGAGNCCRSALAASGPLRLVCCVSALRALEYSSSIASLVARRTESCGELRFDAFLARLLSSRKRRAIRSASSHSVCLRFFCHSWSR